MRNTALALLFTSLLAFGQTPASAVQTKTLALAHTSTVQDLLEAATLIRSTLEIPQLTVDDQKGTISVTASSAQLASAEWLARAVDQPPASESTPPPTVHEYRIAADDVVRVFAIHNDKTVQEFQEIAVLIRSLSDIRRLFTYNSPHVIAMRGTAAQAALAEWLLQQIDQPNSVERPAMTETYHLASANEDTVRIFFLKHTDTVQSFQEAATVIRSIGEIRRVFTYNGSRALALRGTAEQVALAEWMSAELDQPAQTPAARSTKKEFRIAGSSSDLVRIFYLDPATTVQSFQVEAVRVRTATRIARIFVYNAPRLMAVRGTPDQIAMAERLVQQPTQ